MSDRRCLVALCHNMPIVFTQTVMSLMEIGWGNRVDDAKARHGFAAIDFAWFTSYPRVDALRDQAVTLAQREGFSHLLFLDVDMNWPTDVLMRMLAHHDRGVVSGLYVQKAAPYAPIALRGQFHDPGSIVDQYFYDQEYDQPDDDGLRVVDIVGMGCALIPMAVFAAIGPRPWFEYRNDDDGWPRVTEDVPFCQKAKAAGFNIYLDPTVKCGHIATIQTDEEWHKRWQRNQREIEKKIHVTVIEKPAEVA